MCTTMNVDVTKHDSFVCMKYTSKYLYTISIHTTCVRA